MSYVLTIEAMGRRGAVTVLDSGKRVVTSSFMADRHTGRNVLAAVKTLLVKQGIDLYEFASIAVQTTQSTTSTARSLAVTGDILALAAGAAIQPVENST